MGRKGRKGGAGQGSDARKHLNEKLRNLKSEMKATKQQLKKCEDSSSSSDSDSSSSVSDSDDFDSQDEFFVDFASQVSDLHSHCARKKAFVEQTDMEQALCSGKVLPAVNQRISIGSGKDAYLRQLGHLQVELNKLQAWVLHKGLKVAVVFEGRDTAGKGGVIRVISETLNPRNCRVIALPSPTDRQKTQWYFQRYSEHLPAAGEIVLFDRSWYNRAGVEKVMGFCSDSEYEAFLRDCPMVEKMWVESGIILLKYWLDITQDVQDMRLKRRMQNPTTQWKLSKMDLLSRTHWSDYTLARDRMFEATHKPEQGATWYVVAAQSKALSRLNLIRHLLDSIDYSVVPHDLPDELKPVAPSKDEPDICKVDNPKGYVVVAPVYHDHRSIEDAACEMLTFGKHVGKSFRDVLEDDPGYCIWAMEQQSPSPELARFACYVNWAQGGSSP